MEGALGSNNQEHLPVELDVFPTRSRRHTVQTHGFRKSVPLYLQSMPFLLSSPDNPFLSILRRREGDATRRLLSATFPCSQPLNTNEGAGPGSFTASKSISHFLTTTEVSPFTVPAGLHLMKSRLMVSKCKCNFVFSRSDAKQSGVLSNSVTPLPIPPGPGVQVSKGPGNRGASLSSAALESALSRRK